MESDATAAGGATATANATTAASAAATTTTTATTATAATATTTTTTTATTTTTTTTAVPPTGDECQLSLKVMRLSRPLLDPADSIQLHRGTDQLCAPLTAEGVDGQLLPDQLLLLPQSCGDIHMGETFACYVSVFNGSDACVYCVSVRAEFQTWAERPQLAPVESPAPRCEPGRHVGTVFQHRVTQVGAHMLICSVHYQLNDPSSSDAAATAAGAAASAGGGGDGGRRFFRKLFKFDAKMPVQVVTRLKAASSGYSSFLETEITNCSPTLAMFLERIRLRPSTHFRLKSASTETPSAAAAAAAASSAGSSGVLLSPQSVASYVFCLEPAAPDGTDSSSSSATSRPPVTTQDVGRLELQWRRRLGEPGHLQVSVLHQRPEGPAVELTLHVQRAPGSARRLHTITILCRLTNRGRRALTLSLQLVAQRGMVWRGRDNCVAARLAPGQSAPLPLQLEPRTAGLLRVGGVVLTDKQLSVCFTHNNIVELLVL